ncbi:MAG: hypothetical protein QOG00_152, partial [Pyrinomonadaceae bacterium]|nr:hypothetical protein [Pyrinomonadaceae bacterium]
QTIDFSDLEGRPAQWTVILGDNGVGKTTILQVLSALVPLPNPELGKFIQTLPSQAKALDDLKDSHKLEQTDEILYPRFWMLDSSNILMSYIAAKQELNLSAKIETGVKLRDKNSGNLGEEIYIKKKEGSYVFSATYVDSLKDFICFGYGASRRMGETSLSEQEEERFASLFNDNAALMNAEEWLLKSDYAAHAAKNSAARKQSQKRRDEIKDVLINLLPEVEDIRFTQLTEKQLKPGVEVKTPYGWVSIKELSLGYKTLVAWMVDFASRMFEHYSESPNPLAEAAVVLIDEIDLHLHPKWQRTLMCYLSERFPNTQFIATAHSPLVVQAARDANIVLLKRVGNHVVIDNDVKAIHGWRVDQILTSDLFGLESARPPQLDALLEERTNLLSKARLTKKDRERLREVENKIGSMPTGETPEDIDAMDVIRRAAKHLKAQGY